MARGKRAFFSLFFSAAGALFIPFKTRRARTVTTYIGITTTTKRSPSAPCGRLPLLIPVQRILLVTSERHARFALCAAAAAAATLHALPFVAGAQPRPRETALCTNWRGLLYSLPVEQSSGLLYRRSSLVSTNKQTEPTYLTVRRPPPHVRTITAQTKPFGRVGGDANRQIISILYHRTIILHTATLHLPVRSSLIARTATLDDERLFSTLIFIHQIYLVSNSGRTPEPVSREPVARQ